MCSSFLLRDTASQRKMYSRFTLKFFISFRLEAHHIKKKERTKMEIYKAKNDKNQISIV